MAQANVLNTLYGDLNRHGQKQEYERAIKVANKILQQYPDEGDAFDCKVVSLVLLDRFEEALSSIHKLKKLQGRVKFEKAYSEYRLNRTQDALETLRSISSPDRRSKELLAQVLYRLEEYSECYDLYRDIVRNSEDDFDAERQTNLTAVIASLNMWDNKDVGDPEVEDSSYELSYNTACYYIGRKDYKTAEKKLLRSEAALKADPDLGEEELDEELAIIRVQLAYVLQQQKRINEANKLYNQVLHNKPSDVGLLAVASNNIVTLNKDQNMFDSKRKMKAATGENLKHKLSSVQRRNIQFNQCLLHMYASQTDQCNMLSSKLMTQYPDIDMPFLIQAAQYAKDKNLKAAAELLKSYGRTHPEQSFSLRLVIVQLYLSQGAVYPACDALKNLGDLSNKPGIVSALVTLYQSQEDITAASDILNQAVSWYKKHEPTSSDLMTLTTANANFQLKNGNAEAAAFMLEDLRKSSPNDPRVLAQLISAYSKFNTDKAEQVSKDLPPVEEISSSVDVDALEAAFSTLGPKYMKKATGKSDASPAVAGSGDALIKKKKKKNKKGKLPKNYDPKADIDSERWLPRRERSYYRGKKKDKRRDISKGTQGSAAVEGETAKSPSGSSVSSPLPGHASPGGTVEGPRQQKPSQASKKYKKKGKKW